MNVQRQKGLKPGEARCPGPSTMDIVEWDGQEQPVGLQAEAYEFLGDEDIPITRYTDPAFFQAEMDKMWNHTWQWACREEHIPEVGDHYVYEVGTYSIIVTRVAEDEVKAYWNACLHRGTKLAMANGSVDNFRCSFHGWTWNLDGTLKEVPCDWDFPHVDEEKFKLPEVKVGRWGGFIFINMDKNAGPLEDQLGTLKEHFVGKWDLSERYTVLHVKKLLPANWKTAQEAFLEAYHVLETHPQGLPNAGDANCQYDIFDKHVTRFHHTIGFKSPHIEEEMSEQQILESMRVGEGLEVKEGERARTVVARELRKIMGEELKVDLSDYTDAEMLDSIEYHMFPNMFLFPGVTLPMIYRFRPNGMNPDESWFDLLFLKLKPEDMEEVPDAPEPEVIGIETSYTEVPGMDQGLGAVYDQDTLNLRLITEGLKTSRKPGITLGNYQEARIRRIHMTLMEYLDA